ncbi:fasciclin domain-containing protein [Nodosilinea nodulosa]|uniref:fasciclin domain-containing protein n=1 Tax=Nodosilinea nodulosa TaxID=416001 RepID=UPI0003174160|nr:fasciclin domain-containing protein [Nodosilinea nodulosa]
MTPNTIRMALGLLLFGAAPVAIAAFPQQAISDTQPMAQSMSQPEAPDAMEQPEASDTDAPGAMEQPEAADAMEQPEATDQATDTSEQSIAEIAAGNDNLKILTAAIEAAGLTDALNNDDLSITVFAPTDEAFEALPEGTLDALMQPENRDQLAQLLSYHVVDGEMLSTDLKSGEVDSVTGAPITIMVDDGSVKVNDANVVASDIEASNGVIHVIDSVLLPM